MKHAQKNYNAGLKMITFFVPGTPKPGGSKRGFINKKTGRVIITEDCKKNKEWRSIVSVIAFNEYSGPLMEGPLMLTITFVMPRPKYHYNTKGILKPSAPTYHTSTPDASKLTRSTEDSLKGIVWKDDSLVAIQKIWKIYGEKPGAHVTISVIV